MRAPHTLLRRRLSLAAAVVGAILLLGGSAYAASVILERPPTPPPDASETAQQVQAEYDLWRAKLELPPGATWHHLVLPEDTTIYYGNGGVMAAFDQAIADWCAEWIAAAKVGDKQRVAAAIAALERLRAAIPISGQGMTKNQGGYDTSMVEWFDTAFAAARQGDFQLLRDLTQLAERPTPDAFDGTVDWAGGGATQVLLTHDQLQTEYRAAKASFVLPPGRRWPSDVWLPNNEPNDEGSGFEAALMIAWTSWWSEWVAAVEAGDQQRAEAAADASSRLAQLLPHVPTGPAAMDHRWLALEEETIADFHILDGRARRGDMDGVRAWLSKEYQKAWLSMK